MAPVAFLALWPHQPLKHAVHRSSPINGRRGLRSVSCSFPVAEETGAVLTPVAGATLLAALLGAQVRPRQRSLAKVRRKQGPDAGKDSTKGLLSRIKSLFKKGDDRSSGAGESVLSVAQNPDAARIVVSSAQAIGLPFCGEYEEQPAPLHERSIFRKVGLPANSQPVYLLFNEAKQWAFTPHEDGRADGWAFASDAAGDPWSITGTFSIWDEQRRQWTEDPTMQLRNSKLPMAQAPVGAAAKVASQPAAGSSAADASAAEDGEETAPAAVAEVVEEVPLPPEAEHLGMLHWKAHWHASEPCLIKWPEAEAGFTNKLLPSHQGVKRGVLPNGLRYVLLKNAMPPRRFEAHIELHVGSIDEGPREQGIAHMMEHVCFLGSRKRERLIGTGSKSNALTDFQHTIYHIHAPVSMDDGRQMYLPALEALHEIAFAPEMLPNRIEKERKAVLAEMQQVNDMEYRIETWTLSGLHETNKLGTQFPIGLEEQIKSWQQKDLRNFHAKWYYPGNATLYVVGDLEEEEMLSGIRRVFEPTPGRNLFPDGKAFADPVWGEESADPRSLYRRTIANPRPEQLHNFSLPMIGTDDVFTQAAAFDVSTSQKPWHGPIRIFRNELLESFQVNFYAKAPVRPLRTLEDLRHLIAVRILIGVLQFRIVRRYSSNHAPVQIDHSDSFREGCAVTSVTVNADPRDWRNAVACVVQEIRCVCDYGVTESEMKRYMDAMLKDVEKGIAENESVPSEDHLNFIMTSDVFDHTIMYPEQTFAAFEEAAPHVTMEQIHVAAKWMLGFIGYYGKATAPPPSAVVVCTPTQVYDEGTNQWTPFQITEEEITDLLLSVPDKSKEEALNQVEVPESLLSGHLERLLGSNPIDAMTAWRATSRKHDEATGITQLMLPNGARVNYACQTNESQGLMRLLVPGGRSADAPDEVGASMVGIRAVSESGAVSTFCREQIELFAVSNLMSCHLDLNYEFSFIDANFSMNDSSFVGVLELLHLLFQEPRWELPAFVRAQQAYKATASATLKSLEQSTMNRLTEMMCEGDVQVSSPSISDLNKLTMAKVRRAVSSQLRPQDLEINLVGDFDGKALRKTGSVEGALSTGKHREEELVSTEEVEVPAEARERRLRELDEKLWRYLGSVPAKDEPQADLSRAPLIARGQLLSPEDRQRTAHLEDSDERAVANIGGGAPNRWGQGDPHWEEAMEKKKFSWDAPASEFRKHPLYPSVCLLAMREVINTRLFTTVRDQLGLSYDCSFELSLFDRLKAGWFTSTVSSHPSRIGEAVEAARGVLTGVRRRPISEWELNTARRTLMRRHETDLQSNEYWISLLTHLQYDNPKDIRCVRDIVMMFQKLTWRDVQNAYTSLMTDPDELFVSISTAGPGASYTSGAAPGAVTRSSAQKQLVEVD